MSELGNQYRAAARLVLKPCDCKPGCPYYIACCEALWGEALERFRDTFRPRGRNATTEYWFGSASSPPKSDKHQHARAMALCFAAAMADRGDL